MSDELDHSIIAVTELASVPENARGEFHRRLLSAIDVANIYHKLFENMRLPSVHLVDIVRFLMPVITAAGELDAALARIQGELSNSGERSVPALKAAALLRAFLELADRPAESANLEQDLLKPERATDWLANYRRTLAGLIGATPRRGRRKDQFSPFVRDLYVAAQETGGRWTHSKLSDRPKPEWHGSLMQALEILRPFLPSEGFFPKGSLGRRLEDILTNLRKSE